MNRHLITATACCLALLAAPVAAQAETETATSGPVTATFVYTSENGSFPYKDLVLRISRGGVAAADVPVSSPDCADVCWPGGYGERGSVSVRDLNADGEPEVILDLFSGGAHCCSISQIYSFDPTSGPTQPRYTSIEHNFADPGYRFTDRERDGIPEFSSSDGRFAYALSSYAGSGVPVQIWRFTGEGLVDVTKEYPKLIAKDSRYWWKIYRKYARRTSPNNDRALGALAAWAGDEYLLGHGRKVQRELRAALRRGWLDGAFTSGRKTIRALNELLASAGYR
jgi:hypothetical protein